METATLEKQSELKTLARSLKIELIIADSTALVDNCLDATRRIKAC